MAPSDTDLLRQYASQRSEAAFTELVRRHLDFVYAAARRQLGSSALAADVAQSVFVDLARHAASLHPEPSLVAWLHIVTRRTAVDLIRRESRRRTREQTASALSAMDPSPSPWSRIAPLLDEALSRLNPTDRTAVLLRFFENKSLREVGAALNLSDDAAQKRLARALEKLRASLARRGVAVTAAGLVTDLSAHALEAAPATLGPAISTLVAAPATAAIHASTTALAMTVTQKVLVSLALVTALGGTLFEARIISRQNAEIDALQHRADQLQRELRTLHRERDTQAAFLADLQHQLATERAKSAKFAAADPAVEAALDDWLQNVVRLKQALEKTPASQIPELRYLTAKDWLDATKETKLDSDLDVRRALSQLRLAAKHHFLPKLMEATHRYLAAHHNQPPADPAQLAPFFDMPVDPAILQRYGTFPVDQVEDFPHVIEGDGRHATWTIRERQPADDYYDYSVFVTASATGTAGNSKFDREVMTAVDAFRSAHNGQSPADPAQLEPYLRSKIDPAFVRRRLDRKE